MMSPVGAMFWQIWKKWRWGLVVGWAYLIVAAVVARLLPDIMAQAPRGAADLPDAGTLLAMPCMFIAIHVMAVFAHTGAGDLKDMGFPTKSFALPVRTRTLVAWPMIWGCLALVGLWLIVAVFVLRATGNATPLWWPAAALAVGLSLLQALSWIPLAQAWLRIFFAALVCLALVGGAIVIAVFELREPIATAIFLGWLPLIYAVNVHCVAMARRGDAFDWGLWNRLRAWWAALQKPVQGPFVSAARAQLWFECRCFGWSLPLIMAAMLPGVALIVWLDNSNGVAESWRILVVVILMPVGFAAFFGSQLGKTTFPFLATRPINSAVLVRGKFQMALVSALAAYIPVFLFLPIFFLRPEFIESLRQTAEHAGIAKVALVVALALVLPVALTWKELVKSFWIGLAGRAWLTGTLNITFAVFVSGGMLFTLWVWIHPDMQFFLRELAPWLVGLLLVAKLVSATWVLIALRRAGFIAPATASKLIGIWCAATAALGAIVGWLIPGGYLSMSGMFAVVALFVPFSRLAGAPLAVAWNRHR